MKRVLGSIRRADERYHMIEDGDRICIGVSGGKDSLLLMEALKLYQNFSRTKFEVCAVSLDLGIVEQDWESKHIELDMEFPEVTIHANQELMKEVFINLLHNAIKFSPDYGPLQVRILQQPGAVQVRIVNSGQIPEEDVSRIFQKFYQADRSHFSAGNGVGLAIVKKIVELHHGTVQAESRDGAVSFTVTLPETEDSL